MLQGLPDVRWSVQAEVSNDLKMVCFRPLFLEAEKADLIGRKSRFHRQQKLLTIHAGRA